MKKIGIALLSLMFIFTACKGEGENKTDNEGSNDVTVETSTCDNVSIEDFDTFLGIKYGTKELMLEEVVGKFTGGEYTSDSTAFIYYFNRVERVPLAIWVNAQSGKVETIFMEILSYEKNFEKDLHNAKKEFKMTECDAGWFGMKESTVKQRLGTPDAEDLLDDNVRSISYDSEEFLYSVNFKFYPSQDNKCTSVSINWFY